MRAPVRLVIVNRNEMKVGEEEEEEETDQAVCVIFKFILTTPQKQRLTERKSTTHNDYLFEQFTHNSF